MLPASAAEPPRPNILWLSSEDHGPHLGCYGDRYAQTPNVDRLAAKGMIYTRVWSNAPVCAPARTTLISGLYPTATGSEHMRSLLPFPADKAMFPRYLRDAGYFCSNRVKEDYNLIKGPGVWDDSSAKAHFRARKAGQPFFAVFNSEKSHESKMRVRPYAARHDPSGVRIPAYHPDTPEVRQDWAQYYDVVSDADADAGARLKELEADGLTEETIVFYFADHGSGMPRNKRSACNSGLRVPLVVYIPPKFRHLAPPDYRPGGSSDRFIGFVDFAPTVLALAGVTPPTWMHGKPFLGPNPGTNEVLHGYRGRMDERIDLVRSVTDGRYVYVRNYYPHKPAGQYLDYMFQTPTTRVWKKLFDEGKLTPAQSAFWKPKATEELYDLTTDPDEVKNLADDPAQRGTLERLRQAQQRQATTIRDVDLLPEGEMHRRADGRSPYDLPADAYSVTKVLTAADRASRVEKGDTETVAAGLGDPDAAVRYWSAVGLLFRGATAVEASGKGLRSALSDRSPDVQVAAAEALARFGTAEDRTRALETLVARAAWGPNDVFTAVAALNALDNVGPLPPTIKEAIAKLPRKGPRPHQRYDAYVPRLIDDLTQRQGGP